MHDHNSRGEIREGMHGEGMQVTRVLLISNNKTFLFGVFRRSKNIANRIVDCRVNPRKSIAKKFQSDFVSFLRLYLKVTRDLLFLIVYTTTILSDHV